MKTTLIMLCMITLLSAVVSAQPGSLVFDLRYSQSSYQMMTERGGEEGISSADFGTWLAENVEMTLTGEGSIQPVPDSAHLTILTVDSRGTVFGRVSMQARVSDRPILLGNSVPGREFVRNVEGLIDKASPILDMPHRIFPVSGNNAGRSFTPHASPASMDQFNSMALSNAVDTARQLMVRESPDTYPIGIVLMLTPDPSGQFAGEGRNITSANAVFVHHRK